MTDEKHMYWATAAVMIVFIICATIVAVMR